MTGATFLESVAALVAYEEGKAYGINGQLAILFCIRNRVAAGQEEGNLGRILQVHFFTKIGCSYIPDIPEVRDPAIQQLMGYVEGIFDNSVQDKLTDGALYWGTEKPIGAKERVAQVGTLLLWK